MSAASKLRETIDRLVEDSIRRILPEVMNEVLLKAVANMSTIQETHSPVIQTKRVTSRTQQQPNRPAPSSSHLQSLLEDMGDGTAGADFYDGYGSNEEPEQEQERDEPPTLRTIHEKVSSLPSHLQAMTDGIDLSDFDGSGESWDTDGSHVSNPPMQVGPPLEQSAARVGMDFARMRQLNEGISKKTPKVDAGDRQANAQFEMQRIKRNRERLNEGKPVEG